MMDLIADELGMRSLREVDDVLLTSLMLLQVLLTLDVQIANFATDRRRNISRRLQGVRRVLLNQGIPGIFGAHYVA